MAESVDRAIVVPTVRLVPKDPESLAGIARELRWRNTRVIQGTDTLPEEDVYETSRPNTTVHRINDPKIDVEYLAIAGDEREAVAAEVRVIREFYSLPEILRAAKRAKAYEHKIEAIYYLALLAPDEFDREIFEIFVRYFEDPNADVRGSSVIATSYVGWREFIAPLGQRASMDPDVTVREDAAMMVANLQKYPARSFLAR